MSDIHAVMECEKLDNRIRSEKSIFSSFANDDENMGIPRGDVLNWGV